MNEYSGRSPGEWIKICSKKIGISFLAILVFSLIMWGLNEVFVISPKYDRVKIDEVVRNYAKCNNYSYGQEFDFKNARINVVMYDEQTGKQVLNKSLKSFIIDEKINFNAPDVCSILNEKLNEK